MHLDLTSTLDDSIIYAVGDVHGMDGLLGALVTEIEFDAAEHGRSALVIFLGDMVNRGPATCAVLERLLAGPRRRGDRWICLRGNHEQAFVNAFGSQEAFERFLRKGGVPTLLSYGIKRRDLSLAALRASVPSTHVVFMNNLPLTCRVGERLFVHAGVQPGLALDMQTPDTLMNIREPFLSVPHGLPLTIVHGHVPSMGQPVFVPGRICVDTGAVITGVLTAAVFDGNRPARFLQTRSAARRTA